MLDYFNNHDYWRKSDFLRGKLDPSLHFPRTGNPGSNNLWHPETGDYHSPTLLCQSLPIFADLCMTDQMQIWKWTSTPASVLLCIVRSTYAAVSRPTISSSSVSSLREMAEKYSIIWASAICRAHNFLCLLPLWDWGGGCLGDTFPLLRQWGQWGQWQCWWQHSNYIDNGDTVGTILGHHSKISGAQDCRSRLHQSWLWPLFIKQGVPK